MTARETVRNRIEAIGIIPWIRAHSAVDARFAAETIHRAGISIIEVTATVPHAPDIIADLSVSLPDVIVGAGLIFDVKTARLCVRAGARFVSSPGLDLPIVEFASNEGILAVPGALTPTEVTDAWHAGAEIIRIFPCGQVGGAAYIRALKGPFPDLAFVAVGGVNQQTAADFITAGAAAIAIGPELIPRKAIEHRDDHRITELARRFLHSVQTGRGQKGSLQEAERR